LFARESYLYRVLARDLRPQRLFLEFSEKTFHSYLSDGFAPNQEFILFYPYIIRILWCTKGRYTKGRYTKGRYTKGRYTKGRYTEGRYTKGRYTKGRLLKGDILLAS